MRARLLVVLLLGAFLCTAAGCSVAAPFTTDSDSYDTVDLAAFLKRTAPDIGGAALFVARGTTVIADAGYARFGTEKVVNIGTSARWLAAAAMMTLIDDGMFSLDDPVSRFLPEFGGEKRAITVRQLWSGTSGLADDNPALNERSITLEECVRRIAAAPLAYNPGTLIRDGRAGIEAGARICEVISGMPWEQFFHSRIAAPLGMVSTTFDMMGLNRNLRVASAARSTARDYGRFLIMLLQKGRWGNRQILSESSVDELLRNQSPDVPVGDSPYTPLYTLLPETRNARPGVGGWIERAGFGTGATIVASCPGDHGFVPWIDLSGDVACVLSVQSDLGSASYVIAHVRDLIRAAIAKGPRTTP